MPPTIYEEILAWSKDRPAWQRDALRRLATKGQLSDADYDDLSRMCLAARGLDAEAPSPVPLAAEHLPQQGSASATVTLNRLCNVKNVGALLPDQFIEFGELGLTIVYGDNGSGKSSYARILKRLCRARGAHEELRANVFVGSAEPPLATVAFAVGEKKEALDWKDDGAVPAPAPLSHVAVFDQLAATAYVGDKQDASVRPAGLDLLTSLASACEAVRARIQGRIGAAKVASRPLTGFEPATSTGAFVTGITASTKDEAIDVASAYSEADRARTESLAKDVARLDAEDPVRVAKELRARRARIDALRQRVENIRTLLSPDAISRLETVRKTSEAKEQAAALASSLSFDGALPGTGGEPWRELWEAARRYSTIAHPQQPFPVIVADTRCVLCQQALDTAAQERLARFEAFVRDTAAAEARAARATFDAAKTRLRDLRVALPEDSVLIQELDEFETDLGARAQTALEQAEALRAAVNAALSSGKPLPADDVAGPLVEHLQRASANAERRAQEALSAHDPTKRKAFQQELAELKARASLAERKSEVLAYARSVRMTASLEKCLGDAATNAITSKNSELTKRAVTESLKALFEEERKGLGLNRTPVELAPAGGKSGVLYHQLSLRGAKLAANPMKVLSEGEQRVCALATFLAESRLAQSKSSIIFDDPVSSFDHLRREAVARRLAREAVLRQVIVFTHDAVFLLGLLRAAEEWAAPLKVFHVQTHGSAVGHCSEGLPWVGMNVSKRIGSLKNDLVKAEKIFKSNDRTTYNAMARQLYGQLRETWERAIEEVLFGDAIQRLRLSVETKKLKVVDIQPGDYDRIEKGMGKASAELIGHDQPAAMNTPAPQPEELKTDILDLEEWVKGVRQRREKKS